MIVATRFYEQIFGVYFDDLDPFQILHNARYLLLFERTMGAFWDEVGFGTFQDEAHPGQFHLVARNEIDYVRPVRGVGKVRVRIQIERMGRASLTFGFRMMPLDRDEEYARGRRVIVHVAPGALTSSPWPDAVRATLAPWLPPAAPTAAP